MGYSRKAILSQSLFDVAKSFAAVASLCLQISCAQKAYAPQAEKEGREHGTYKERTKLGIKLTETGQNFSPQFSLNEAEILFISEKRRAHQNPQLYAIDLNTFAERRLTFQDGQIYDAISLANNQVSYSSTTDEHKERPLLFYPDLAKQKFPSTEIYLANAQGLSVARLTQEPGFDGLLQRHPFKSESLIFSKWQDGHLQLWQLNTKSKARLLLRSVKDRSVSNAQYSTALKKWLWIETLLNGEAEIWTGDLNFQKAERLNIPFSQVSDPQWIPGQSRMSFLIIKDNKSESVFWDLGKQCLGEILKHDDMIYSLRWSKLGIAIEAQEDQTRNIYFRALDLNSLICKESPENKKPS